jgi:acyl transferase domain-containing protein
MTPGPAENPVAIIGIGCRFPGGADSPDAFWRLLAGGVDAITEIPPERFASSNVYHPTTSTPRRSASRRARPR